jgi:hypothetical protein
MSAKIPEDHLREFNIYLVSKYGTIQRSKLQIEDIDGNTEPVLVWRTIPRLSCKFSCVRYINDPIPSPLFENYFRVSMQVNAIVLTFDINDCHFPSVLQHMKDAHRKAVRISSLDRAIKIPRTLQVFAAFATEATLKEEQLTETAVHLRQKEAWMVLERTLTKYKHRVQLSAFSYWIDQTREMNMARMQTDRHRWRLHAASNQEIDLQAWYHALFYQEVYRLRGKFFYKDAILPVYRQSYDLVDNALTPLEEAALAHVLCSPDTTYGDVAGQMFIVHAIMPGFQYELFQKLAAEGCNVIKHPRQGRPAKKLFRFSFVEGNIYLTWKGKFGNQGVGMGEVTDIVGGIQTDILKWSAQSAKAGQYLSVLCADRSIDLYFESVEERNKWRDVLTALVKKEQGDLQGIAPVDPEMGSDFEDFDWLVLYGSIGKKRKAPAPGSGNVPPSILAAMQRAL